MRPLDWAVLLAALAGMVAYGVWKGRRTRDLDDFLVADRRQPWHRVALSIMATQASAITFLATPGQAFTDGMRFVQVYLGLPVAMVILAATAVPIYHRLKVYTAYEYLEGRFDLKTRTLAALLFLALRGLSTGVSLYAPSLILSAVMGWDIRVVIFIIGGAVMLYASLGGARAVDNTNFLQFLIIMGGMFVAFFTVVRLLPSGVSFVEATRVAGKLGRLNAVDFSFDIRNQYNFWSGLIGGCFLALAYFGTDHSQVQRYLSGGSVAQSRLGLLFNGLVKVPMQFFILFLGAMVFAFYQFTQPPVFFNPVQLERARSGPQGAQFRQFEGSYAAAFGEKQAALGAYVEALRAGDGPAEDAASRQLKSAQERAGAARDGAVEIIRASDPKQNDTNYVFLSFVTNYMPAGLVGLVLAAVFLASMSSTASEWSALASATVVDIQRRLLMPGASERFYFISSKLATVFWGLFAVVFAQYAGQLGSLVEAVNRLGSLFYGTLLGIFLLGFYFKRVGGTAAFLGALVGEAAVLFCFFRTPLAFLWYNVVGAAVVVLSALLFTLLVGNSKKE